MDRVHIFSAYNIKEKSEGIFANRLFLGLLAVFLLGRVVVFEAAAPFGLAFLAAYITFDKTVSWRYIAIAVIGFLGTVTAGAELSPVKYMLAFVLFGLIFVSISTLSDNRSKFAVASMGGIAMLISGLIFSAQKGFTLYDVFILIIESVLCLVTAKLLQSVMPIIFSKSFREGRSIQSTEELAGIYLVISLAVLGLANIKIGPVVLGNSAAAAMIMLLSMTGGITAGAVGGIVIGILFGVTKFPITEIIGVFGFCGFVCGAVRRFNKAGVILCFFVANAALSLYLSGGGSGMFSFLELLIGVAIFALIPKRAVKAFDNAISATKNSRPNNSVSLATQRLGAISEAFSGLAKTFSEAVRSEQKNSFDDIASFFDKTADKVCKRCGLKFICWEKQFNSTYDYMMKLSPVLLENGSVKTEDLPAPFRDRCIKANEFISELNRLYGKHKLDLQWMMKLKDSRELAAEQFDTVAKMVDKLATELEGTSEYEAELGKKEVYTAQIGTASKIKDGQSVSGDNYLCMRVRPNKYILILSDGMGSGKQAAGQSNTTVRVLEQLLSAGFDRQSALKIINSVLLIKENEECFATIDVAVIDMVSGEAEFIKIGANASYIKHSEGVEAVTSSTLPAGILNDVDVETSCRRTQAGDYIIMISDGIHSAADDWMTEFLSKIEITTPQAMADEIIAESLRRRKNIAEDDMTVIAVKIMEK